MFFFNFKHLRLKLKYLYTDCISAEGKDSRVATIVQDKIINHGEALVLELWGMRSNSSLSLQRGPLWPGVLVAVRVPSMDKVEIFDNLLYLKPFNYVKTNDWCLIDLLGLHQTI